MAVERRTVAGWCHYLNGPDAEYTITELMAKCLIDIRDNLVVSRLATEHVEGMVGSFDELMATTNGAYGEIAEKRSRPSNGMLSGVRDHE